MKQSQRRIFLVLLFVYAAASLFHYVHNAVFLDDYPNMPAWLSPAHVYFAWLGVTAVGIAGVLLILFRFEIFGLALLGIYAALGFDGMGHYSLAPVSEHTIAMNLSIWLEALAAAMVLIAVSRGIASRLWSAGQQAR